MTPRMRAVTVVGESIMDIIQMPDEVVYHAGGSPLNVAVGLARLGVGVRFVTELGADTHGRALAAHLTASGVPLEDIREVPWTSSATAELDENNSAHYTFDVSWTLADAVVPPAALVHTGSLASWLSPGCESVLALLADRPSSTFASVDANVRPALLNSDSSTRARVGAPLALANLAKLSDEDAAWLFPAMSEDGVADHLLDGGAGLVVITRGARGALLATPQGRVMAPARAGTVVDTVGAGDSFTAGLLGWIVSTDSAELVSSGSLDLDALGDLATFASLCAAVTVSRRGADPPFAEEVGGLPSARGRG